MLKTKHILITGASTGIGLAATNHFINAGYQVIACARKNEDLSKLHSKGAVPFKLDVTNRKDVESLPSFLSETVGDGELLALINNAGIARAGPWECLEFEELEKQFATNVTGLVHVTQKTLPWIRKAKGRIINISSISGRISIPFLGPYCASKTALESITDSLRRELIPSGVKVISINPGPIQTPIWDKREGISKSPEDILTNQGLRDAYETRLKSFAEKIQTSTKNAEPVDKVIAKIHLAITEKNPKIRYYVGKGIGFRAMLQKHLPDSIMDRLIIK